MNDYELIVLKGCSEREISIDEIAIVNKIEVSGLYSVVERLKEAGAINVRFADKKIVDLSVEGNSYLQEGFPEENVVRHAFNGVKIDELKGNERTVGLQWAIKKGLVRVHEGKVYATENGKNVLSKGYDLRKKLIAKEEDDELIRRKLIEVKKRKEVYISITDTGRSILKNSSKVKTANEIDRLTGDMLLHEDIDKIVFKKYNVCVPGEIPIYGRKHILNRFMDKIRSIFIEMGFEEMEGNLVESAFWNFDVLFQPQDHPARELADTFYLKAPSKLPPDEIELVTKVKSVHEKCWGGSWSIDEASRAVLRTHTTAVSARKLSTMNREYGKFFSIGRVFRKEAIDYKHLAEFHQVEGIVAWEGATFRNLLWILREFYNRLGFERIIFKPSYFPYTEPSLEIHAFFKEKGVWVELGGAGIFREEVCYPLFGKYPVLAWGLSLERPLMVMLGIEDIRTFYRNDLDELERIKEADLRWL